MTDKELIDKLAILHDCITSKGKSNRTALAKLIQVEYTTLATWYRKNEIPTYKAYGKLYLVTLFELKLKEKELNLYKDVDEAKKALENFKKENNEIL